MDAITLLKNDHRKVERIFARIQQEDTGNREELFRELKDELDVHAQIEEQLFYPAVREAKPTHDIVLESFQEHA